MAAMIQLRSGVVILVAAALSGCGQANLGPQSAVSAPSVTSATPVPDFAAHAGETYAAFVAQPATAAYSLTELGVAETPGAGRFEHAMAHPAPGLVASGGGVEALVFSGCAPTGCLEGLSVVAIDVATGDVFVGVSDMAGTEKLVPNDRLEALLRLTSPSQSWDDPVRPAAATAAP